MFASGESWLLVFDDADTVDKEVLLQDYWPATDRGSILITSRDKSRVKQFNSEELSSLSSTKKALLTCSSDSQSPTWRDSQQTYSETIVNQRAFPVEEMRQETIATGDRLQQTTSRKKKWQAK